MLPWIILAVVVVPLTIYAFAKLRSSRAAGEGLAAPDPVEQARIEQEFAEAEAYQEQWRAEERKHQRDILD